MNYIFTYFILENQYTEALEIKPNLDHETQNLKTDNPHKEIAIDKDTLVEQNCYSNNNTNSNINSNTSLNVCLYTPQENLVLNRNKINNTFNNENLQSENKDEISNSNDSLINKNYSINIDHDLEGCPGHIFVGFLNFFANEFDYKNYVMNNIADGTIEKKSENSYLKNNPNLCIINYMDPNNNIAKPVVKYEIVLNIFREIIFNLKFLNLNKITNKGLIEYILEKVNKNNKY